MNADPRNSSVYIVDDDPAIRDSLRLLMKTAGIPVQTFQSADEFLAAYTPAMSGCLLLDIRMPGISGLQLQRVLKDKNSHLPIIIMTGHGDIPTAVQAMKAGARDFLEKPFNDEDLLQRTRNCIDKDLKDREIDKQREEAVQRLAQLTPREREIMNLLAQGKINKVIAAELDISTRTVEAHRANIMEKLQTHSLADLVRLSLLK